MTKYIKENFNMCLIIGEKKTKIIKEKLKNNNGEYIFYKVLSYSPDNHGLKSPIQNWKYSPKINRSNRKSKKILKTELDKRRIYKGIHVYTSLTTAKQSKGWYECIIPVRCKLSDFVVAGNRSEAVFTKIYIDPKDYDRIVKQAKIKYTQLYS